MVDEDPIEWCATDPLFPILHSVITIEILISGMSIYGILHGNGQTLEVGSDLLPC